MFVLRLRQSNFLISRILSWLLIVVAFQAQAENKLPDVFWVKCDYANQDMLGNIDMKKDYLLLQINMINNTISQKTPQLAVSPICENNRDAILFGERRENGDCSKVVYFNKWNGQIVSLFETYENCRILDNSQQPLFR